MAQCHIPVDEGTKFLHNTNHIAQSHISEGANPVNSKWQTTVCQHS